MTDAQHPATPPSSGHPPLDGTASTGAQGIGVPATSAQGAGTQDTGWQDTGSQDAGWQDAGANETGSQGSASAAKDGAKHVASTAQDEAKRVGSDAKDAARSVAGTAKEEATQVAGEARRQAKALYEEARTQLSDQAGTQQGRAASALHGIGEDLDEMSRSSQQPGLAAEIVGQVATRARDVASWLEAREPADVLREVQGFARRKPGTFIAICAVAGLVAGRLVRSLAEEAKDDHDASSSGSSAGGATRTPAAGTTATGATPEPPITATPWTTDVGTQAAPRTVVGDEPALGGPALGGPGATDPALGSGQPRLDDGRLP